MEKNYRAIIEAILFTMGESVELSKIAEAIELDKKETKQILESMMDGFASVINNNVNQVMKFLASITIILSIPTMLASFWGMNVNVPFANNTYGFGIVVLISIIMTIIVTLILNKKDMLK